MGRGVSSRLAMLCSCQMESNRPACDQSPCNVRDEDRGSLLNILRGKVVVEWRSLPTELRATERVVVGAIAVVMFVNRVRVSSDRIIGIYILSLFGIGQRSRQSTAGDLAVHELRSAKT